MVDAVNERSEEHHHRVIGVVVVGGNCRKERAEQSSGSWVPCSSWVEEDMHSVAVAWHAVMGGGECVPLAIVVDDSLLARSVDVGDIV
jgi:hypothetical protein